MAFSTSLEEHERTYHGVTDPEPPSDGPSGIPIPNVTGDWARKGVTTFPDDIASGWTGDKQGVLMGRASGDDTSKRGKYSLAGITQHDSLLDLRAWQDPSG
jgi:hypothetical protein